MQSRPTLSSSNSARPRHWNPDQSLLVRQLQKDRRCRQRDTPLVLFQMIGRHSVSGVHEPFTPKVVHLVESKTNKC